MYLIRIYGGCAVPAPQKRAMIGEIDAGIVTVKRDCANLWDFACQRRRRVRRPRAADALADRLSGIGVPCFRLLFVQLDVPKPDLTVKATGKQWFWSYSYPDNGNFEFDSLMVQDKDLKPGQPRLLTADSEMVVPVNKVVHVLVTGADVIHSFTVPSFGIRMDAIPGRINETWFKATSEG